MDLLQNRLSVLLFCGTLVFSAVAQESLVNSAEEQPKGFSAIGEQLSGGSLSPENKEFVSAIFQKMGAHLRVRRSLESFSEHNPAFRYVFTSPMLGYCYLNEPWFNTLSEQEKKFVIARTALDTKFSLDLKQITAYAGIIGGGAYGLYKLNQKLNEGAFFGYKPGKLVKGVSFLTVGIVYYLLTDKLILRQLERYKAYQKDKEAALALHCVDGALSALQKMDDKNAAFLVNNATRIERLQKLKNSN